LLRYNDRATAELHEYSYDNLDRLKTVYYTSAAGVSPILLDYSVNGNIKTKSDVGVYKYDAARPHRAVEVSGTQKRTYAYDDWGNVVRRSIDLQAISIAYSYDNLPTLVKKDDGSGVASEFEYSADRALVWRRDTRADKTSTETYSLSIGGELYQFIAANNQSSTEHRHTIHGSVVVKTRGTSTPITTFLLRDHLDSIVAELATDETVLTRVSYDAFGAARPPLSSLSSSRSFANIETLDEFGVLLMGVRLYDPALGRFLAADPSTSPTPGDIETLNQYSYVSNNPTSNVDPSGHFKKFFKKVGKLFSNAGKAIGHVVKATISVLRKSEILQTVLRVAVTAVGSTFGPAGAAAANGAYSALLARGGGGNALRAFALGAVTAFGFNQVGSVLPGPVENVLGHGVVGGVSSVASGGKFLPGFVGAAVGGAGGAASAGMGAFGQLAVTSVAGGTASAVSGGSFGRGAMLSSVGLVTNSWMHGLVPRSQCRAALPPELRHAASHSCGQATS
jgi:RHS repeat-associated protein